LSLPLSGTRIGTMKVSGRQYLARASALGLLLLSGCTSFDHDWKQTASQPAAGSLEGRWEGRWLSEVNHHTGSMRCLLKREGETRYQARFKATYARIFTASYRVEFMGEIRDGVWEFHGDKNLGWLAGGVYHYRGRISPTNFFSTYECKYDHGTFELHRPE